MFSSSYDFIHTLCEEHIGKDVILKGWVRNIRVQNDLIFMEVFDGLSSKTMQCIIEKQKDEKLYEKAKSDIHISASLVVNGVVVKSPASGQLIEVHVSSIPYIGKIEDPQNFILCAKKMNIETLRGYQEWRAKTKTFNAVFRIRGGLMRATHEFFEKHNLLHLDPNVITTSDCEGAGEAFTITNLHKTDYVRDIPQTKDGKIDYNADMFSKHAFLTVSSQLQLEALCSGLSRVYTTNPSFRAEHSMSNRHLASFTHIEYELAWINHQDLMNFTEDYVKYCFGYVLEKHIDDLKVLDGFVSKGIIDKLNMLTNSVYERISYKEALKILNSMDHKEFMESMMKEKKIDRVPVFGDDLGSVCEKYLTEVVYKKPIFVYDFPASLKSFYMKSNGESVEDGETVQGSDLLIPGLGELVGESIREENYEKLCNVAHSRKMDVKPIEWYMNLRKNGTFPHGGAGLGFDRLVSVCTFMEGNVRDVVPFPVCYKECRY
jgi:asparaginyl-tRNA synthetase